LTVFDAHCDTIYQDWRQNDTILRDNPGGQLDLERTSCFSHYAQFFALFADAKGKRSEEMQAIFDQQHRIFCCEMERNQDAIRFCRTGSQAQEAFYEGKAAAFLSVEGADLLGCSLTGLERAWMLGVRAVNLTWNHANRLSGSAIEDRERGLGPEGKIFAGRMQELGMLVDVSHLSEPGFWDVIALAHQPIMASHSNARAVWDHPRNLCDPQLLALFRNGGVVGLNFYAAFLGEDPDLDTVLAHIEHVWSLGGEDHLALGGDWDGCDTLPRGMENGIAGLSNLYEHLLKHNYRETLVDKLYYKNLMKVVGDVCTM